MPSFHLTAEGLVVQGPFHSLPEKKIIYVNNEDIYKENVKNKFLMVDMISMAMEFIFQICISFASLIIWEI